MAPSGNSPVRNLRPQRELVASCAGVEVGSAEGTRLAVAAVLAGTVGSRTATADVAEAAAAVEFPAADMVLSVGKAGAAEVAVARRVPG